MLNEILRELVKDVAGSCRSKLQSDPILTGLDRAAIKTAADQIEQQQRERVKAKLEAACKNCHAASIAREKYR